MCMMNEVVPLAARRSRVFRFSRKLATNTKVPSGHQPGNGNLNADIAATDAAATPATAQTYRRIAKVFCINRGKGFPACLRHDQFMPSLL